ncbi:MAG: hypothetical protein IT552_05925 [Sphingomonadaceae bacterium]|nr:hypothetical protein [Sphingomonadaceae bacterium]
MTGDDSQWIPVRQVREILIEAGLFNSETPRALIARAKAGLLPVKAKRVTYDTPPRSGSALDDFIFPARMLEGLGFAELDITERIIKSPSVREGNGIPKTNFKAFDVEFGRAAILDFAGLNDGISAGAASASPSQRGRKPGDGSYERADTKFVDMIIALLDAGEVTSATEGARLIVDKHQSEIRGSGDSAVARLASRANKKLADAGNR